MTDKELIELVTGKVRAYHSENGVVPKYLVIDEETFYVVRRSKLFIPVDVQEDCSVGSTFMGLGVAVIDAYDTEILEVR